MPGGQGYRARTRDTFSRPFRGKGYINLSTYLRNFKIGDYVDVKVNGAVHKVRRGARLPGGRWCRRWGRQAPQRRWRRHGGREVAEAGAGEICGERQRLGGGSWRRRLLESWTLEPAAAGGAGWLAGELPAARQQAVPLGERGAAARC